MEEIKNFKRYQVDGQKRVFNRATGQPVKLQGLGEMKYYRLTDDKGQRKYLFLKDIIIKEKPKPEIKEPEKTTEIVKIGPFKITQTGFKKLHKILDSRNDKAELLKIKDKKDYGPGEKTYIIRSLYKKGLPVSLCAYLTGSSMGYANTYCDPEKTKLYNQKRVLNSKKNK